MQSFMNVIESSLDLPAPPLTPPISISALAHSSTIITKIDEDNDARQLHNHMVTATRQLCCGVSAQVLPTVVMLLLLSIVVVVVVVIVVVVVDFVSLGTSEIHGRSCVDFALSG